MQSEVNESWRVTESDATRITIYDNISIPSLTQAKIEELQKVYCDSFRYSIWSTVLQDDNSTLDQERTQAFQDWHEREEGRNWFKDALQFYIDETRKGNCKLILAEDARSGKIIVGFFVLSANAFLDHAEKKSGAQLEKIIERIGASKAHTFYGSEFFVSPDVRGYRGGKALFGVVRQTLSYAIEKGYTHIVLWTLDRADNHMIAITKKIGFRSVPDGIFEKGVDLGQMENGELGFIRNNTGQVAYLYADAETFLARL